MLFRVLGAIAELERSIIRERVIAGQKAARKRGVRFGRPNVAVPLAEIEKLRKRGLSWRGIEAETGIAKDTLRRALGQPKQASLTTQEPGTWPVWTNPGGILSVIEILRHFAFTRR